GSSMILMIVSDTFADFSFVLSVSESVIGLLVWRRLSMMSASETPAFTAWITSSTRAGAAAFGAAGFAAARLRAAGCVWAGVICTNQVAAAIANTVKSLKLISPPSVLRT